MAEDVARRLPRSQEYHARLRRFRASRFPGGDHDHQARHRRAPGRSAARLIEYAKWCESLGYDQFWYANEWFYRDMYVGLTLVAQHTSRMRLGTFVADPYTRHPVMTAIAIASVDDVSGGRAMLLLGASGAGVEPLGIPQVKPGEGDR